MTSTRGEGMRRVEREIVAEKAATLGRAGERLEHALEEARSAARRLLGAREEGEREQLAREYAVARRRALEARLALLIQREAVGLRRHVTVDQQFPEPPAVEKVLEQSRRHGGELDVSRSEST
jgi:hypothetical protein